MSKKLKPEFFISFWDENPTVGSGWRGVAVTKYGNKWVHFTLTGTGDNTKLPKHVWGTLAKHVVRRNRMTGEIVY